MQLEKIQTKIYEIRGQKVMLDSDLAELYEVETRILNQAVKRNMDIFPEDFMFQLSLNEWESMSSQFVMTYPSKRPKSSLPLRNYRKNYKSLKISTTNNLKTCTMPSIFCSKKTFMKLNKNSANE